MKVEVVRSPRRRKTVQAREIDGVLRVSIPATMTASDERRWVAEMVRRMERRSAGHAIDLVRRAGELAGRYRLERPTSISWSDNQEWRWGSCTPSARSIRISSRLAGEPHWVLDYVIVHELAHLSVAGHNRAFWSIVNRYPLAERARGFLMARGHEPGADHAESESDTAGDDTAGGDTAGGDTAGDDTAGGASMPEPGPPGGESPRRHRVPTSPVPRQRAAAARKAPAHKGER